jgi:hypothetical protein
MANSVTLTNAQAIGTGASLPATPPPLTTSQVLTRAAHANVNIEIASATAINIDVPDPTTCTVGDEFRGINNGAGALTLRTHLGGALTGNAILPATLSQYDGWLVRYTSAGFRRLA